jgi:hypothetical protein
LTGNGLVFTTRFAGGRGGRNALESGLRRLGITQKNGNPNHPQTQGKAGRFQQTLKDWLRTQPAHGTRDRVRTDHAGKLTLRVNGGLHYIGTGHEHVRTPVLMLVHDLKPGLL